MSATATADRKPFSGSYRKIALLVGVLFLSATATFFIGSALIVSYFSGDSPQASTLLAGVLFEGVAALAGAGIGLAMLPVLSHYNVGLARGYAALRILEGLMMISAGVYMVAMKKEFAHYDAFICLFTTSAGLIFSYLLYVSGLIPRFLAQLGLVGYTVLAIGIPVTLMGAAQLDVGWGLIFVVPGGLFELIVPLLLVVKGFSLNRNEPRQAEPIPAPA
jgi:hypothetical protein